VHKNWLGFCFKTGRDSLFLTSSGHGTEISQRL
jgi:hypothetical protein